jgi:hypothetical protein
MDAITLPPATSFDGGAPLLAVLNALRPFESLTLVIEYDGRTIQPGYHVTEVKAGSFVTLDCGGNPDTWLETILQVEDLPASAKKPNHMAVGKFLTIIAKVAQRVLLDETARLTFEVGRPGQPMQILDVDELQITDDGAVLRLCARPAICKPRHRAQAAACCSPETPQGGCCAPKPELPAGTACCS